MTTLLLTTTTDADAAVGAAAAALGIGALAWLALLFVGIIWLIFPFIVWAKLNRLIDHSHRALNNLRVIAKAAEEPDQPPVEIKP
jgi:hypothetical protein